MHPSLFLLAVGCLLLLLCGATVFSLRGNGRMRKDASLEGLLARLSAVDRGKLARVVTEISPEEDAENEAGLESWQIYELVGGMEGLTAIAANCEVLIDLACHVQQWYPEALPVAEQLRLNAREIQWHIERLRGAERRGNLQNAFPDYAGRAVAIYCRMTGYVLQLYEVSQTPGLAQLEAVL